MLPPQSFVLVLEGFLVTVSESVPVLKYVIFLEAVSVPFLFLEYFPVPNIGVVPVTIVVLEVSLSVVFLHSHSYKTYIMVFGVCIGVVIIVTITVPKG